MKKVFTIPLVNTLIQWINEKLQGKSDINHSHSNATQNHSGFMSFGDKVKVDAIPANPKYTDTVYAHPSTHPASMITQDSTRRMVSDAQITAWDGKSDINHTHEEYAPKTHSHSEYLTELPTHSHSEYLTASDLPAPVDLSEYPTRFEVQTAVQSVADPVIVLTEAEFAAIVPDATKIYVIY